VLAINGAGGLLGGLAMSTWGGPPNKVLGVIGAMLCTCLFGIALSGAGRSFLPWAVGAFGVTFFAPIANGCSQAIWNAKVAPDVQGRVFGARRMMGQASLPLGMLAAGPLADHWSEPALRPHGSLASLFGPLVGVGPGAGMSLMLLLAGLAGCAIAVAALLDRPLRRVESDLPDQVPAGSAA